MCKVYRIAAGGAAVTLSGHRCGKLATSRRAHRKECLRMTRKIHGVLAHIFGVLIVIQLFLAGLDTFTSVHNKRFNDSNFDAHAALGTLMILVALVIALIAVAGR